MALQKKIKTKGKYSKKYLQKIKMKDFMGKLTPDEIEIARETGNLRWDLWAKAGRITKLTFEDHKRGFELAPVFDGFGNLDPSRYPENVKFLIKNYEDLTAKSTIC